jgi:hypothetical protein
MVKMRFTEEGTKLFGQWGSGKPVERTSLKKSTKVEMESKNIVTIRYSNGPLFELNESSPAGLLVLALFDSEIWLGGSGGSLAVTMQEAESASGAQPQSTDGLIGAGAVVAAPFGAGCVVCLSPHAESSHAAAAAAAAASGNVKRARTKAGSSNGNDLTRVVRRSVVLALSWWAIQDLLHE